MTRESGCVFFAVLTFALHIPCARLHVWEPATENLETGSQKAAWVVVMMRPSSSRWTSGSALLLFVLQTMPSVSRSAAGTSGLSSGAFTSLLALFFRSR